MELSEIEFSFDLLFVFIPISLILIYMNLK